MFLILCMVALLLCLWYWWYRIMLPGKTKLVDGCLPIIGHTHKIIGDSEKLWNDVQTTAKECTAKGGVTRMIIGLQTYYVITDPEEGVLASNLCIKKHFAYDFAKSWLGDGLVTSTTAVWKRHRKLLNPAFTLQILHGFLDIFNTQSRELIADLEKQVGKGEFDISILFRRIALKTLSRTAFGLSDSAEETMFRRYANAVDETMDLLVSRFQNTWLQSNLVYKLSGLKRKEDELVKVLNDMSNKIIKEKRAALNNNETDSKIAKTSGLAYRAFLDILLSSESTLTVKEIREEVDTAIVAGFDTSSWLLTYLCAALGTYDCVQEKVYEEITNIFGDSDRDVEKEDLLKLVYTEAVIKETLRLYPIIPLTLRTAETDVQLKNHTIKSGDHLIISLYGINRHTVWGPDGDLFRPDRWLHSTVPNNAFAGFSIGKRGCIGKTYAMMSMKTTLVHLLRRYRFSGDVTKLKQKMDFIMKPISGHFVSIHERHQRSDVIRNCAQ